MDTYCVGEKELDLHHTGISLSICPTLSLSDVCMITIDICMLMINNWFKLLH